MQFLLIVNVRDDILESDRPENYELLVAQEQAHTRKTYLEGWLRQIWLRASGSGAIGIIEADSLEDAERVLAEFPFSQAGLLETEIIALAPYTGFGGLEPQRPSDKSI